MSLNTIFCKWFHVCAFVCFSLHIFLPSLVVKSVYCLKAALFVKSCWIYVQLFMQTFGCFWMCSESSTSGWFWILLEAQMCVCVCVEVSGDKSVCVGDSQSTSSCTYASLKPRALVALQMYWPERERNNNYCINHCNLLSVLQLTQKSNSNMDKGVLSSPVSSLFQCFCLSYNSKAISDLF